MIIESITLNNFRQFLGEKTIEFSTDKTKKATLIIAPNGTGKTTLLEAFSWCLYGRCDLQSIINERIEKTFSKDNSTITVKTVLIHNSIKYNIVRKAYLSKDYSKVKIKETSLIIKYINEDGESSTLKNSDAQELIDDILPEDLFPYFFFKGESIERIGKEISSGKSTSKSHFVEAIRGMLGFNWLYQERADLERLSRIYGKEIEENQSDTDFQEIQKNINECLDKKAMYSNITLESEKNVESYSEELEKVLNQINESGIEEITRKQQQHLRLLSEMQSLTTVIASDKSSLFKSFSKHAFQVLMKPLSEEANKAIEDTGDVDAGIPGIDIKAIEYMLSNHRCICGEELIEGSEAYNNILRMKDVVPPNKFGANITEFQTECRRAIERGQEFIEEFDMHRSNYKRDQKKYNDYLHEDEVLSDQLQDTPDVSALKELEKTLRKYISEENQKIGATKEQNRVNETELNKFERQKDAYAITDKTLMLLRKREDQVNWLIRRIDRALEKREKEKREELEAAINEIFLNVFQLDLSIVLGDDYSISFKTNDGSKLSDHFENSTSQDAILAFAFIGGIIKLARNKTVSSTESSATSSSYDANELDPTGFEMEPYPLLMDAPTSSFDLARIDSFCEIMPNIAEQVIFFIKDTDGYRVRNNIESIIGKEYRLKPVAFDEASIDEV